MTTAGAPAELLARVLRRAGTALLLLLPALALVDRLEGRIGLAAPLLLLGPVLFAGATAAAAASARADGSLDGWTALGRSPARLGGPTLAFAGLLALLSLARSPTAASPLALPAPLDGAVDHAWLEGSWRPLAAEAHRPAPSALGLSALVARAGSDAPPGARVRVDSAELGLRIGWAGAWVLAAALGLGAGLRGPRRGAGAAPGAVGLAAGATAGVLLLVALSAAWAAQRAG